LLSFWAGWNLFRKRRFRELHQELFTVPLKARKCQVLQQGAAEWRRLSVGDRSGLCEEACTQHALHRSLRAGPLEQFVKDLGAAVGVEGVDPWGMGSADWPISEELLQAEIKKHPSFLCSGHKAWARRHGDLVAKPEPVTPAPIHVMRGHPAHLNSSRSLYPPSTPLLPLRLPTSCRVALNRKLKEDVAFAHVGMRPLNLDADGEAQQSAASTFVLIQRLRGGFALRSSGHVGIDL
jgi:hypothetical protein